MDQDPKTKKTDKSGSALPKAAIACLQPKINSVRFEDPHDRIKPMKNIN